MSESRVWFVTGASRGFGRIWTEAALERGDRVVATARDASALAELADAYGDAVHPLALDVTDRDAVFDVLEKGHRHFGRLDVILSNAGYAYMGAVEELSLHDAKENFETNLWGTLSVIQAALPILRSQGSGHILTMSSIGGVISFPTGGAYLASKFAVEAMSEALAGEVASFGIKVTIIEPGPFATGFGAARAEAPAIPAYEAVRQAVRSGFKPEEVGDPQATAAAILAIVDAEKPPLRLVLGSTTIPLFRAVYEQRLKQWDDWSGVSANAQGKRPA